MLIRNRSKLASLACSACLVLGGLVVGDRASADVPAEAISAAAAAALVLAVTATCRNAAYVWRGPPIRRFSREHSAWCEPGEACAVRAAAQLRGTLGGAGHVHRARLALSTSAWLAAAIFAAATLVAPSGATVPLLGGAVLPLSGVAALFPARPFYYREAMGGRVLVHPRDAADAIVELHPPTHREAFRTPLPANDDMPAGARRA